MSTRSPTATSTRLATRVSMTTSPPSTRTRSTPSMPRAWSGVIRSAGTSSRAGAASERTSAPGVSSATTRPAAMIATRSHSASASSR